MAEKQSITKDMTFGGVLQKHPECAEVMMKRGMHCVGCPASLQETIEQGAIVHGMSKEDIDEMLKEMNDKVKEK